MAPTLVMHTSPRRPCMSRTVRKSVLGMMGSILHRLSDGALRRCLVVPTASRRPFEIGRGLVAFEAWQGKVALDGYGSAARRLRQRLVFALEGGIERNRGREQVAGCDSPPLPLLWPALTLRIVEGLIGDSAKLLDGVVVDVHTTSQRSTNVGRATTAKSWR